jgi:hypothetical protein
MKPIASLFGLGVLLIGVGGVFLYFQLPYLTAGKRVEGTVVDIKRQMNRRGTVYHPVVQYHAAGRSVTITGAVGAGINPYRIGETVNVVYLPDDPESGVIGDFIQLYLFPALFGGLGLACILGALVAAYVMTRQRAAEAVPAEEFSVRPSW